MKLPWSNISGIMWLVSPLILLFIGGLAVEIRKGRDKLEQVAKANQRHNVKRRNY